MCCGGTTQKPSDVMAAIQARKVTTKVVPMPIPTTEKTEYYSIPKEVKQQLLMAQQHARIPQKTG